MPKKVGISKRVVTRNFAPGLLCKVKPNLFEPVLFAPVVFSSQVDMVALEIAVILIGFQSSSRTFGNHRYRLYYE